MDCALSEITKLRELIIERDNEIKRLLREIHKLKGERVPKDFRTRQLLRNAIGDNDFLKHLDIEQIRDIVDFMYPLTYSPSSSIITEGEPGEGTLEVLQDGILLGTIGGGKAFGELALLYNCKRTATVRALSTCKVWALQRRAFQRIMVKVGMRRMEDRLSFLSSIPLLKNLQPMLLAKIADHLEVVRFQAGSYIIREGASADSFFIISQGRVQVRVDSPTPSILKELGYGDYFGEQALIEETKRSATVVALPPGVECLTLDRTSFLLLIGNLDSFDQKTKKEHCEVEESGRLKVPETLLLPSDRVLKGDDEGVRLSGVELDDLEVVATLGVGGFGRVELVQVAREPNHVYALKCLPKTHILATQQKEHVYAEKNIMASCNSPFIVTLYKTFKDKKCLYLLMEACLGGEVWSILRDKGSFDEDTTKFTVGCVLLALHYLHTKSIIYRDLKPENLMIANNGYVKLIDFGFSKVVAAGQRTWTFCGTPEYVAPEVILNRGHDRSVDFWAVGVLLFELLTGLPPWGPSSKLSLSSPSPVQKMAPDFLDPLNTYNQILKGMESVHFPKELSRSAHSLIRRLCKQSPGERLGATNGVSDIMSHRWFNGLDWDGLKNLSSKSPLEPRLKGPKDVTNFDKYELEVEEIPDDETGWDVDF